MDPSGQRDPAADNRDDALAASLKPRPLRFPKWLAALLALAAMWLTIFLAWPIGAVIAAAGVAYLLRQRQRRLATLCILLSPYVLLSFLSAALGVISYCLGTAQLRTFGMPHREFYNLDERWRVYHSTSGCIVDGSEIFTHVPNNAVVKLLVTVLGPMPGVYRGPYPSKTEAVAQLAASSPVSRESVNQGGIVVSGQAVQLEKNTVTELVRQFPTEEFSGVLFGPKQELLLLTSTGQRGRAVTLIDRQRGRSFATYYDELRSPAASP